MFALASKPTTHAKHLAALRSVISAFVLTLAPAVYGQTPAAPNPCALKVEDLTKMFGVGFEAGVPEATIGKGCRYKTKGGSLAKNTDFSVLVEMVKPSGTPDSFRKLMGGPMHEYREVPGDPDRAIWVKHGGGVPSFPSISYDRGGFLVSILIQGIVHTDPKLRTARVEEMNQKLLKLPRLP